MERFVTASGIECILSAMKQHEEVAGVQHRACIALIALARRADMPARIDVAGGIECIVHAIDRHSAAGPVGTYGRRALAFLSLNADCRAHISQKLGTQYLHPYAQDTFKDARQSDCVMRSLRQNVFLQQVTEQTEPILIMISMVRVRTAILSSDTSNQKSASCNNKGRDTYTSIEVTHYALLTIRT